MQRRAFRDESAPANQVPDVFDLDSGLQRSGTEPGHDLRQPPRGVDVSLSASQRHRRPQSPKAPALFFPIKRKLGFFQKAHMPKREALHPVRDAAGARKGSLRPQTDFRVVGLPEHQRREHAEGDARLDLR